MMKYGLHLRMLFVIIALTGNTLIFARLENNKVERARRWVAQQLQAGHKVSDRVMAFYNRLNESSKPADVACIPLQQVESNLANLESNLVSRLKKRTNKSCDSRIVITRKDVSPKGLIIDKPGEYCLAENIKFAPCADNIPAITITASYVTLDLNGHTLSECPNSFAQFDHTSAIIIKTGASFVTVKNGFINGFSDHGILAESVNQDIHDHQDITVEDINVTRCGKPTTFSDNRLFNARSAIGIDGTTGVFIRNCEASFITAVVEIDVIAAFFAEDIIIEDCLVRDCTVDPTQAGVVGISLDFFHNAIVKNSESTTTSGFLINGILGLTGSNLLLKNCQSLSHRAVLEVVGIFSIFVNNTVITDTISNENVAQSDTEQSSSSGIESVGNNVVFRNCAACGNILASTINAPVSSDNGLAGYVLQRSSNVLFDNCVAFQNQVLASSIAHFGAGFAIVNTCSDVVLRNCIANNTTSANATTPVIGFLFSEIPPVLRPTARDLGCILDNCVAENNRNTQDSSKGFGVAFATTTAQSCIKNCTIKRNNIGISVQGSLSTTNYIAANTLIANTLFGIQDLSGAKNAYVENFSYNPGATNYSGLPAGTPIRTWVIGNPPAASSDKIDNLDVT